MADYILVEMEPILREWESFAATLFPAAQGMTPLALRDHAEQILRAVAADLSAPQTRAAQSAKSRGQGAELARAPATAAQIHGVLRAGSGFDINQMVGEYRALRASVLRRWMDAHPPQPSHLEDVTRFNEAVDQALAESVAFYASRVEQARNLFLGMLGHDMRTPLQAMQLTAMYLSRLDAGEEVGKAASRLIRSGRHMQRLLDDLVVFNRIHLGLGMLVNRVPCDLGVLIADEVAEVRAAHPDKHVDLSARGSLAGSWDGHLVQRLLGNLVGNALKYGRQDTPVDVTVSGNDQGVVIEVRNQGEPIEASLMESLFDPLKRGLHRDEPDARGSSLGLGLYIAREVARAHGGEIDVRSDRNETVFVARLARDAAAPEMQPTPRQMRDA